MKKYANFGVIAIVLANPFGSTHAQSQQLYRCGSTYSQTPCATDAVKLQVAPNAGGPVPRPAPTTGLCTQRFLEHVSLKDPESARYRVVKSNMTVIRYAEQPMAASKYLIFVNAKNSYGGYAGEELYLCYLSEDEKRVLAIAKPGSREDPAIR